jgi:hypothetical protein
MHCLASWLLGLIGTAIFVTVTAVTAFDVLDFVHPLVGTLNGGRL